MSGNKNLNLAQSAREIERNFELVQPRSIPVEQQADRAAAKEKIKVRAAQRGEMAKQQIKAKKDGKKKESRLIPAGGAMGMSMDQ
jgi:large subunit ribosomal protein L24e